MPDFRYLSVERKLRYTVFPEYPGTGKHLVIALHGYGQLVEFFSKKIQPDPEQFVVVCPEGMHRFYLEGTSGRVGASWMTREWREEDILQNSSMLEQFTVALREEFQPEKITVLGFSQGVATAARWIAASACPIDTFIAWAGVFPPDIAIPDLSNFPAGRIAVVGNQDPYLQADQFDAFRRQYEEYRFRIVEFDGKHEIVPQILNELLTP